MNYELFHMNYKPILLAALTAFSTATVHAQTEVEPFIPGSTLEGINYFLPRTALRVVVEMEKTVIQPGELSKYAFNYLRLNNVPTSSSITYAIKGIQVESYGMVDKTKAYNVKVKSKTIAPLVTLTPDGLLLSINKEVEQPAMSAVPSNVEAAKIPNPRDFMSQEILKASSLSKMAELCAQEIYDIRESRNALVRGEADNLPKDGAQLKIMLDQLDLQANALEQLFKGTTSRSTEYKVLYVCPEQQGESLLMRFSKKLGVVDNDDLAGAPILLNITPVAPLPQTVNDEATEKKKAKMEKGIYYNVPVRERVIIHDGKQEYVRQEIPMGQFGTTEILSDVLFNKGTTTKVTFVPQTGGIERLEQ